MNIKISLLLALQVGVLFAVDTKCKVNDDENECVDTEYDSYIACMRNRVKRSTCGSNSCQDICENGCNECNCNTCAKEGCSSNCNNCCANFQPPCTNNYCCYKSCHSNCHNTDCRKNCRKTCSDKITEGNVIVHAGNSSQLHNITTVINIRNIINNTNLIDMPVNVENTNINNITVELPPGDQSSRLVNKCCNIISPRHCFPTSSYPFVRCAHYRKHACNNICTAPIMHAQPHQVCDERPSGPPNCHQQVIYIPQPQPRCSYQSTWPYVSCGLQNSNCDGCYSHYTSGGSPPGHCSSACYNEGYGVGPYYRQGPFYRPGSAAVPSCLQTGTCNYGGNVGGIGEGNIPYLGGGYPPNIPLSGVGYPPSTYDNFYSVEVDPATGLNLNSSGSYDASTLNVPDNQPPQLDVVPELVKIETTNYPQSRDSDASVTITNPEDVETVEEPF